MHTQSFLNRNGIPKGIATRLDVWIMHTEPESRLPMLNYMLLQAAIKKLDSNGYCVDVGFRVLDWILHHILHGRETVQRT